MPALKYWDIATGSWQVLVGGNAPPAYQAVNRYYNDQYGVDIAVNATSYGVSTGPTATLTVPAFSAVAVWFSARVTLGANGATTSDLYATISATGANTRGPFDSDGVYIPPQPAGSPGPGFIAGVMNVVTNAAGSTVFKLNWRVSGGTTQLMNRRMVVIPNFLIPA